jgi:hypothetical protein
MGMFVLLVVDGNYFAPRQLLAHGAAARASPSRLRRVHPDLRASCAPDGAGMERVD